MLRSRRFIGVQEIRHAIRGCARAPGFTLAIVLVLALSIGAVATVLSLLRGLAFRPLPVPRPHELVQITTRDHLGREADLTFRQFMELIRDQRVFPP